MSNKSRLPLEMRDRLSESSQDLERVAYNSTIYWYGEGKAHKVASNAVCQSFECFGLRHFMCTVPSLKH